MRLTPARLTIVMVLAVSGLTGAYVVKKVRATDEVSRRNALVEERDYLLAPIAVREILPGTRLASEHLLFVRLPPSAISADVLLHAPELVGQIVTRKVAQGELIRASELSDEFSGIDVQQPAVAEKPTPEGALVDPVRPPALAGDVQTMASDDPPVIDARPQHDGDDTFVAEIYFGTNRSTVEFRDDRRIQ